MTDEHDLPSKSERKREYQGYQALARRLIELPAKQLELMPLDDRLREQVEHGRGLQRGALKRQIKYLGSLIADADVAAIRAAVDALDGAHRAGVVRHHTLERWRDRLIDGDDELLETLARQIESFDRQHVRQLARNARRERERGESPRGARALFRYLAALPEAD